MPYLKNVSSLLLTLYMPLTQTALVLRPNEISRLLSDEEALEPEIQRSVSRRDAVLLQSLDFADVCSPLIYTGMVSSTEDFPENPSFGWIVVAENECLTPQDDIIHEGWAAMYVQGGWKVYCRD